MIENDYGGISCQTKIQGQNKVAKLQEHRKKAPDLIRMEGAFLIRG